MSVERRRSGRRHARILHPRRSAHGGLLSRLARHPRLVHGREIGVRCHDHGVLHQVFGLDRVEEVEIRVAGLFMRSLNRTTEINPGFDVARLTSMSVQLGTSGYDDPPRRELRPSQ